MLTELAMASIAGSNADPAIISRNTAQVHLRKKNKQFSQKIKNILFKNFKMLVLPYKVD